MVDVIYVLIVAALVAFVAAAMTWASRMAARKGRSRVVWVFWTFSFTPLVLVLWCLPPRASR
jgi:hypothetical protein